MMNAYFTQLDMTDYEDCFVGFNEIPGDLPINRQSWLRPYQEEPFPNDSKLALVEEREKKRLQGTSSSNRALVEERSIPKEPEEEEEDEDEEEEYGDEYGEEGEGGEDEYGDYGDYGEEDPEEWKPRKQWGRIMGDDKFFVEHHNQTLQTKYNEIELANFMKLLSVKPHKQWQDEHTHHYKTGIHAYEDDGQQLDPAFHLLSETERKLAEEKFTREWRRGQEVRFELKEKKPAHNSEYYF